MLITQLFLLIFSRRDFFYELESAPGLTEHANPFSRGATALLCVTPGFAEADSLVVHLVCFYESRFMNVALCLWYRE